MQAPSRALSVLLVEDSAIMAMTPPTAFPSTMLLPGDRIVALTRSASKPGPELQAVCFVVSDLAVVDEKYHQAMAARIVSSARVVRL